jgi:bacterioferritin
MRGNEAVIKELNAALRAELTAIVQYMVQAEVCANWGYQRLSGDTKKRAFDEMHHAESLIERLLFLDAMPAVDIPLKPNIGADVKAQMEFDLKDEHDAVAQYNAASKICRQQADNGTRELFEKLLRDEEKHTDYLETQLHTIGEIGIANYLSEHLKD